MVDTKLTPNADEASLRFLGHSPDSVGSHFSSVSQRKPDYARRCIIALLVLATFLLAVFLSFLIGRWIAENGERNRAVREKLVTPIILTNFTAYELSSSSASTEPPSTRSTFPLTTTDNATVTTKVLPTGVEKLIPLETTPKNFTLTDVNPPSVDTFDLLEELHGSDTPATAAKPTLLVPLPHYILPLHYDLLLDFTMFATTRFIRGNLTVHLDSHGNSTDDEVLFHAGPNVNLDKIRLRREGKRIHPLSVKREDTKMLVRMILKERLQRGRYYLDLEFNNTICDEGKGAHCYVETVNGSELVTAFSTKFEPTLARSFFPCWDEPAIKATFNVTILHEKHLTVLSNMAVEEKSEGRPWPSGVVATSFRETPPMSTYLLAFAVGEWVPLETRTERNVPLTIWTLREDFYSARFAADFAPLIFDKHEEELEVAYPMSKMDFVAAPAFPVGAMENWGLVVFSRQSLLLDHALEENLNLTVDRLYQQYKIEKIITHELAHQWFGNLVTMRDWSDLWLNEGFATYFVYDLLRDDHPMLTQNEYLMKLSQLVRKQSGHERRALVRHLNTEHEVEQSFHSTHLYTKGCVIVKMIRDLVSEFDFRAGIRRYLRRHAFRSVSREELWLSLPAYADHGAETQRLSEVMEGWLVNEGIPEVHVQRNYETDSIKVSQKPCRNHEHRVFLQREDEEKFRFRRDSKRQLAPKTEETTLFDDALFDGYRATPPPRRQHSRRRKKPRGRIRQPSMFELSESRLNELRKPRNSREPSDLWSIPFSYMFGSVKSSEGQVVRQFWLKNRSLSFTDAELPASKPLLANPEWTYPYRVNYDVTNWKMLARLLHQNNGEISAKSRMQLLVDAELFLGQSNHVNVYLFLLGYLTEETDLGVALVGLDAIYRIVDAFQGTPAKISMLLYFAPVVSHLNRLLDVSQSDPQTAALWLADPSRLSKLYQLRCATNLSSCDHETEMERWRSMSMSSHEDIHRHITAVCHYFFTNVAENETALLETKLRGRGPMWSTAVQLAACSHSEKLLRTASRQIVVTRNAAIYASILRSDFSLHYNAKFRTAFWNQIGRLTPEERRLLFSTEQKDVSPASRILVHSIRTTEELRQVRLLVTDWGPQMSKHLEFVERLVRWQESVANQLLKQFFAAGAKI